MITQHAVRPPSPTILEGSDEENNMDTTRVYFGPFRTPEKRFAAIVAIPDPGPNGVLLQSSQDVVEQSRQRSRSLSLSTSTGSDDIMDVERMVGLGEELEEGGSGTNIATPQASGLPDDDEPSSALANRLLRALDNPSPPPSPAFPPLVDDIDETDVGREDGSSSFEERGVAVSVAPIFSPLRPTQQIIPTSIPPATNEPDLMTFDSFDDRMESATLSARQQDTVQAPPSPFSFPDDIAQSNTTAHQPIESFRGRTDVLIDVQDDSPGAHASILINQQDYKDVDDSGRPANNSSEGQIPVTSTIAPFAETLPSLDGCSSETAAQTTSLGNELLHTPLRRSSRPRKSATPGLKYLATISPDRDRSPSFSSSPRSTAQTRKSKKGKERDMLPPKCDMDIETEGLASGPSPLKIDEKPSDVKAQRRHSDSPVRRAPMRELGSLSPNSADLLTRLIPSATAGKVDPEFSVPSTSVQVETPSPDTLPNTLSNHLAAQSSRCSTVSSSSANSDITKDTTNPSSPARIPATPRRSYTPNSPSKLRLQPISLDDPTRTPARRIPIEQAVVEGHMSPQKLSQMQSGTPAPVSIFTGQTMPVLNMSLKGDSSPARRVFVAPSTSTKTTPRPQSPTKTRMGESAGKQIHPVATVAAPQKAATTSRLAKLPFPLVAEPDLQSNPEKDARNSGESSTLDSPVKSSLKQTSSRIPRKKPYSRPKVAPAATEQRKASTMRTFDISRSLIDASTSKKPTVTPRIAPKAQNEAPATTGKRIIRAVDLSKSNTNKESSITPGSAFPDTTLSSVEPSTKIENGPTAGTLKRKRLDSKAAPVTSSRSTALRQVAAITPSSSTSSITRPTASSSTRTSKPASKVTATAQKPTIMKFRRVIPPNPPAPPPPVNREEPPDLNAFSLKPQEPKGDREEPLLPGKDMILPSPAKETRTHPSPPRSTPPTVIPLPPSSPLQPSPPPLVFVMDPLSPVSESVPLVESSNEGPTPINARRTTRLRKPTHAQPGTDVFSSDPNATSNTVRPLQRRRMNAVQNSRSNTDDIFSGMSMTALKALTANNTVRNQQYVVVNLETEIVRKEGARPESPAVKIKTIVQRQQEERVRQREERARRRARRHGETGVDGEEENGDDIGYESPSPGNEPHDSHPGHAPTKHMRGAGDEEDYETPLKNLEGDVGKRRVKWDKGLFTEVFLDEVVPGTKVLAKENTTTKGCLTATAKTLQLDILGNVVDLGNPLLDLTQESVVVKKFVYDDDVEVISPPATPAVRNTRSKSKKNRS